MAMTNLLACLGGAVGSIAVCAEWHVWVRGQNKSIKVKSKAKVVSFPQFLEVFRVQFKSISSGSTLRAAGLVCEKRARQIFWRNYGTV